MDVSSKCKENCKFVISWNIVRRTSQTVVCFRRPVQWRSSTSGRPSASTSSPCSSRCRATPPSRWPASSSSQTAPTTPPSSWWISWLSPIVVQVHVSQCGVNNEGGPGHHHPPKTSCIPLRGRWMLKHVNIIVICYIQLKYLSLSLLIKLKIFVSSGAGDDWLAWSETPLPPSYARCLSCLLTQVVTFCRFSNHSWLLLSFLYVIGLLNNIDLLLYILSVLSTHTGCIPALNHSCSWAFPF